MAFLGLHLIIMSSLVLIGGQRPECILNTDCPSNKACINFMCRDPCQEQNICADDAYCVVYEHRSQCFCKEGMTGDPQAYCYKFINCRVDTDCPTSETCIHNHCVSGEPLPECTISSECPSNKACINQKCRNPCPEMQNICAVDADCVVYERRPQCFCKEGMTGDPQAYCYKFINCRVDTDCPTSEICIHNHCVSGGQRPECIVNTDCPSNKACINFMCRDPCQEQKICADDAYCVVYRHRPQCFCKEGFTGDGQTHCYKMCKKDADCPPSQKCIGNLCE